jgi:hypothetical protein
VIFLGLCSSEIPLSDPVFNAKEILYMKLPDKICVCQIRGKCVALYSFGLVNVLFK